MLLFRTIFSTLRKGNLSNISLKYQQALRWSNATKVYRNCFDCHPVTPSQVSRHGASLYPQATTPATGAGVIRVQARGSKTWVFRLHRGVRVGERASVVEPHRWADPLRWGRRRGSKGWGLGPQSPWLERADGWFVTVITMVGISQRRDGEAVTAQCTRGGAVFTFGCIDDVLGQEAMVGFRV